MRTSFGPWIVERPVGRGGVATVYRCHHEKRPEVLAAVKVLHNADRAPVLVSRLAREMRVLRRLDHPAIVRVLDGDPGGREPWIALELVEGQPLDRARPGARDPAEVLELARTLAHALVHAHRLGVWHRDVKPGNVLVERGGGVRLVDFGVAAADGELALTGPRGLPGTLDYAPPEWFTGGPDASPAAIDAYALGVMLHEQLTGKSAFGARDPLAAEILQKKRSTPELDPGPGVPEVLRSTVRSLTRAVAAERASLDEVLTRLEAARESSPGASARPVHEAEIEPGDAFVGREAEIKELRASAAARLVTLVGPGGVGKSRLALHHVATVARRTVVVELGSVHNADALNRAVALALGVPLTEADPVAQVDRALAARGPIRLLLDDAEVVLDAVRERVTRWMRSAPELSLLVTSRQKLRIAGERAVAVAPLGLEQGVELLLQRARELGLPAPDPAAAARVVEAVDGLPLGIELVVGRAEETLPDDLTGWLAGGGDVVQHGRATLEAALRGSWERLSARHRHVLACCAVFEGGFGLDLAERVIGAEGEPPLFEVLQGLVECSLLTVRRGEGAFQMLRTVRAFAAQRLKALGLEDELRGRHARAIARLAGDLESRTAPLAPAEVLDARAALAWARAKEEVALAFPLAAVLAEAAVRNGPVLGPAREVAELLELDGGSLEDRIRLRLRYVALLERSLGSSAAEEAERVLAEARRLSDPAWEGRALATWARASWMRSPQEATFRALDRALELLHESPTARPRELSQVYAARANFRHASRGSVVEARADAEKALALVKRDPEPYATATVLGVHALVNDASLEPMAQLARRHHFASLLVDALTMAGMVATRRHDHAEARRSLAEALELARRHGFVGREAEALLALAAVDVHERAWDAVTERLDRARELRGGAEEPSVTNLRGLALLGRGKLSEGDALLAACDAQLARTPSSMQLAVWSFRARVLSDLGLRERAARTLLRAERLALETPLPDDSTAMEALREARR